MKNSDTFFTNSRFIRNAEIFYDEDGRKRVGRFTLTNIEKSRDDSYFTVSSSEEYRLDLISIEFYGTVDLAWAIALANNKSDSLLDWPLSGDVIRIPSYETVQRYV